jgi:putative transposase
MDDRGRWMDNVFIGRLWRSLTHEDIHLKGQTLRGYNWVDLKPSCRRNYAATCGSIGQELIHS